MSQPKKTFWENIHIYYGPMEGKKMSWEEPPIYKEDLEEVRNEFIKYIDDINNQLDKIDLALANQAAWLGLLEQNLQKLMEKK